MAFYAPRRKLRVREHDESGGELNIIPYLDIMMNLIMFMLLSITGFAVLGMLNVTAPSQNTPNPVQANPNPTQNLLLTVGISKCGFFVAATGAVLPSTIKTGDAAACTIPKVNGQYDYGSLTAEMVKIKQTFPQESKLVLVADPDSEYSVVVRTMDATRETPDKKPLFFDVTLSLL
jgi:biopolymer transport protein ExbD